MKNILLFVLLIIGMYDTIAFAQELNANRVTLRLKNDGGLDWDQNQYLQSTWDGWSDRFSYSPAFIFSHGLWITGKRNGAVGCLPGLWRNSFSPGPIINGQPALNVNPQDSYRYRVYKVTAGESSEVNPDISEWPADLGAPIDSSGKPKILGDQMAWMIFNGADISLYESFFRNISLGPRALLPIEVRETVFEHFGEKNDTTIWANSVFFEWAIYNKGNDVLDSVYLSLWTDIDMPPNANEDVPGVDTVAQTGYCWHEGDSSYSSTGYTLLYGPVVPSPNDTAVYFGKKKLGYKNAPLSSFWGIADDSYLDNSTYGPPYSMVTGWNVVRGFSQNGNVIIDSTTKQPTKFPSSGDPITKTGSLFSSNYTSGGAGFMMTTGPITIAPGDSQWIMMALIPSVKLNGVDAINRMRTNAQYLRSLPYDSLVSRKPRRAIPIKPLPTFTGPAAFQLYKNYPNPFNAETIIPFDLPEKSRVQVEIFDLLGRSVAVLPERIFARGSDHSIRWIPTVAGGVYFIKVTASSMEGTSTWSGVNKAVLLR